MNGRYKNILKSLMFAAVFVLIAGTAEVWAEDIEQQPFVCMPGAAENIDVRITEYSGTLEELREALGTEAEPNHGGINAGEGRNARGCNNYAYDNCLNDVQKKVYDALSEACTAFTRSSSYESDLSGSNGYVEAVCELEVGESLTGNRLEMAIAAFCYSNPQFYWLDGSSSGSISTDGVVCRLNIDPYFYSASVRAEADEAIADLTAEWMAELGTTEDSYLTAVRLHDLIIERVNYTYNASGRPEEARWAHSIAGVFTGQGAVCEGYAKTFQYFLDLCGVGNIYIVGKSSGEGHAWNAIEVGGAWYLCDVTWDDSNITTGSDVRDANYTYFCVPVSKFRPRHTPYSEGNYGFYALPEFADDMNASFFSRFGSYAASELTEESAQTLVDSAYANRYALNDYIHFLVPSVSSVRTLMQALGMSSGSYRTTDTGYILKVEALVVNIPAATVSLDRMEADIEVGGTITVTALLPAGSDDRIQWSVENGRVVGLSTNGRTATVKGRRDGTTILTAKTYAGGAVATCTLTVGTGVTPEADYTIWAGGGKDRKKCTIETELRPTDWTDAKGRTKHGKLVWLVLDSEAGISFDSVKHTVKTKSAKTCASVSSKGVVTAKKGGIAYVYCCDTGSLTYEMYTVMVLTAPSKLLLCNIPNSAEKSCQLKKINLSVGETGRVYIYPVVKDGEADLENEYTISLDKSEQSDRLLVSGCLYTDEGTPYFNLQGLAADTEKGKAVSVKVNVINTQSGKKVSLTVVVDNPVTQVAVSGTGSLLQKKDTVSLNISACGPAGTGKAVTDKISFLVTDAAMSYTTVKGKTRGVFTKSKTVTAKYSKNDGVLTLTAKSDAGKAAYVYMQVTNSVKKTGQYILIAVVGGDGGVAVEE